MSDAFLRRCEQLPDAQLGDGAFTDGRAVWRGTREIAHFHDASRALEIRLTKALVRDRRAELKADPRVTLRKNASDWIEFEIRTENDEADALELVRAALAANADAPDGPPPSGSELARRRRFH